MVKRKQHNSSPGKAPISIKEGLQAAEEIVRQARALKVACALCGGVAMHCYGFTRATVDVDFVAAETLPLPATKKLSFGGETYQIGGGGESKLDVDWIVRDDDRQDVYQAALAGATMTEHGLPIITTEWMVILKFLAGRGKDQIDLMWLLREEGLVDRELVKQHIKQLFGKYAYWPLANMDALFLEADVMRARDANGE
jgi:hypothetical protein